MRFLIVVSKMDTISKKTGCFAKDGIKWAEVFI
jgi:hypothetical protein